MTNSPEPEQENRRRRRFLSRPRAIAISGLILAGVGGGVLWAWLWIHRELVPLVEQNLTQTLGRPVELGPVESVSLTSLRFGASGLPPTPTDPDRATTETVEVNFSPLRLLLDRTLPLQVTLVNPDVYIEQAKDGRWISTTLKPEEEPGWLKIDLQGISVRGGRVTLQPLPQSKLPSAPVSLNGLDGVTRFLENNQLVELDVTGEFAKGGRFTLSGTVRPETGATNLALRGQQVPVAEIARLVESPVVLQTGRADGNLTVQLRPEATPEITGSLSFSGVSGQVADLPQRFADTQGQLQFRQNTVVVDNVQTRVGTVPAQIRGTVNTETGYDLTIQVRSVTAQNLLDTLQIDAPVPVNATLQSTLHVKGALAEPTLQGTFRTLGSAQLDRVEFRFFNGQFQLTTTGDNPTLTFSSLRAVPQAGGVMTGKGRVELGPVPDVAFNFQADRVPGDGIARQYGATPDIQIGAVSAIARISGAPDNLQTTIQFQAPEATFPGSGEILIAGQEVFLKRSSFSVAGGTVQATGQIVDNQLQAMVTAAGVQLNQLSEELRGQFSGNLTLSGSTAALSLAGIQATGQVRFSEGLAIIQEPLTASLRWDGQQLLIQDAVAPGFRARGTVTVATEGVDTPQVDSFNLAVQLQRYNLQDLSPNLPGNVDLAGEADFNGRITGTLTAPNVIGDLNLRNFRVSNLAFDPLLVGRVDFQGGRQTQLELTGQSAVGTPDRIALTLGPDNLPTAFLVRRNEAVATGKTVGDRLLVELQTIPVAILNDFLPDAALALGPVSGTLSGNVAVNLERLTAEGAVAIAQPRIGGLAGDLFRAQIRFADGVSQLSQGELIQQDSRIVLNGKVQTTGDFPIQFQIGFEQTPVQNLLLAFAGLHLPGLGLVRTPETTWEEILKTIPIDVTDQPLLDQLRRLSEIRFWLAQQYAQRQQQQFPTLAELQGPLNGAITITGALQTGLEIAFDLQGTDWTWGQYQIDRVVATGNFAEGVLTLLPLQLTLAEGTLAFSGQFQSESITGQLRASNLPVDLLRPYLRQFPIDATGRINATATLAGNFDNPGVVGEVNLVDATLNQQPIQQATLNFRYIDARFNFESSLLVGNTSPLNIVGDIPVALPFATVQPDSDQIRLRASVENEGLALMNLFTDQVSWMDGQGQLNIAVTGTLSQPSIQGNLVVKNATLQVKALTNPLTNVTGVAESDGNLLVVQRLQAQYNQGQINAQGAIPIFENPLTAQVAAANPLTVTSDNLTVNLQGLYQGEVSGNVVITGAALAPELGGTVQLANGEVRLGEMVGGIEGTPPTTAATDAETTPAQATPAIARNESLAQLPTPQIPSAAVAEPGAIAFNNFQLVLGNRVRVTQVPILSFVVEGAVTLNGSLAEPEPRGVVRLVSGAINLFTTQFRLERGYEQTVTFLPAQGFDPILNVRLIALVPEASGVRLRQSPIGSEIIDDPFANYQINALGSLRTVRVRAAVSGPASALDENLSLTSVPRRSEAEIVALIGGRFLSTLGQGDTALGVAGFAGTVLFGNLQGLITELGQRIGLSELRIFPTLVNEPTRQNSVLGLAVEAGVDVTNNLTVSVSRVFASKQPLRYNLLYRINDQILMRGSTDFQGDSRATVEFETRF
ncbi:translocation/assembly module TamB domain-containing protein [Leptothermofonsia sichuanensis E412]|uniref:translocation/assembly module TamB domain-containing protein n=1 Tax=Leptothermofonsia sichuanensis TaxID=2917832 RepID=UPI001CA60A4B|nr:translocation/assembly module TamB domain-containing protein [Leptothermofonsia sichuanensis]QZZ20282.1 translocation/assembly module TamB domain-containing protein [Leptothermofonsia sichuanensis E412]